MSARILYGDRSLSIPAVYYAVPLVLLLVGVFSFLPFPAKKSTNPAAEIDALLQKTYPADAPGAAVIVKMNGNTLLCKGYGMADLELGIKIEPDMVFRLGSITKQFTAVSILILQEQGKLRVEDGIDKYLTDFPTQGNKITIEHLLTHTSGVKSYTDLPEWLKISRTDISVAELIDLFKNKPLEFEPGTQWKYSNSGYILLGAIIEKVSGGSYEAFIQKNIFQPLGMEHSFYDRTARLIPRRIPGYEPSDNGFINAPYISMTHTYAAGSLLSTVKDLDIWEEALQSGKLISKETLQRARTAFRLANGESTGYGYGWIVSEYEGQPVAEHNGGINGFLTHEISLPREKIYVAILHNCTDSDPDSVAFKIVTIALGKPVAAPKAVVLPKEQLKGLAGVYEHGPGDARTISVDDGHIYSQRSGGVRLEIYPLSETEFFFLDSDTRLIFVINADGSAREVIAKARIGMSQKETKTNKPIPAERRAIQLDPSLYDRYAGEYELTPDLSIVITREGGQLMAQATGQPKIELFPETEKRFFLKVVDAQIEFVVGADSRVESIVLCQGGQTLQGKRIK